MGYSEFKLHGVECLKAPGKCDNYLKKYILENI